MTTQTNTPIQPLSKTLLNPDWWAQNRQEHLWNTNNKGEVIIERHVSTGEYSKGVKCSVQCLVCGDTYTMIDSFDAKYPPRREAEPPHPCAHYWTGNEYPARQ